MLGHADADDRHDDASESHAKRSNPYKRCTIGHLPQKAVSQEADDPSNGVDIADRLGPLRQEVYRIKYPSKV